MKKFLLILSLFCVSSAFAETMIECPNGPTLTISNDSKRITVKMRNESTRWVYVKYEQAFFMQLMEYGVGTGEFPNKVQGNFWIENNVYESYYFDLVRMIPGRSTTVIKNVINAVQNRVLAEEKLTCTAIER